MEGLFGVVAAFIYFYQIYDAYKSARGILEDETSVALVPTVNGHSHGWEGNQAGAPPTDQPAAADTESPVWGISLIFIGCAFLLHNFNLIHLESLVRLWPLFVVGTGLLMIISYIRRSAA